MKIDLRGFVPAFGATVLLAACGSPVANAGKSAHDAVAPATRSAITGYEVVATYPHDPEAYTQGLLRQSLASNYFGEGIALLGERIFQLTWLSNKGFVYDLETFDRIGEFSYDTEGWGLTTDGTHLILSDGSDRLFFLDGDEQFVVKTVRVTNDIPAHQPLRPGAERGAEILAAHLAQHPDQRFVAKRLVAQGNDHARESVELATLLQK